MKYQYAELTAVCIGCRCHDLRACAGGCSWLRVDYAAHTGVCSRCAPLVAAWDAGARSAPVTLFEKVTNPGNTDVEVEDLVRLLSIGHPGSIYKA
ncbi:MAG TPA: hypothetical protein VEC35_09360 [Noviherbaspirillum sp.]|nr:hypothetical protein [Noviherbaspirillum sp.]